MKASIPRKLGLITIQAHLTNVYNTTALCKTGDNLLDKMRAEWEALEEMGLEPIGVCGDAAGDVGKCDGAL